jgi:hypothetical protein
VYLRAGVAVYDLPFDQPIRDEITARLECDPHAIRWSDPPRQGCTGLLPVIAAFAAGLLLGWLLHRPA